MSTPYLLLPAGKTTGHVETFTFFFPRVKTPGVARSFFFFYPRAECPGKLRSNPLLSNVSHE
jgi:hypothetical protein